MNMDNNLNNNTSVDIGSIDINILKFEKDDVYYENCLNIITAK